MRTVELIRKESSDDGTFGILKVGEKEFTSGELPWRDNEKGMSCIPAGEYICIWYHSPKFGWCYLVQDVFQRTYILFHEGNFCGNPVLHKFHDTDGCIMMGFGLSFYRNQKIITNSKRARKAFEEELDKEPFKLIVTWEDEDDELE